MAKWDLKKVEVESMADILHNDVKRAKFQMGTGQLKFLASLNYCVSGQ